MKNIIIRILILFITIITLNSFGKTYELSNEGNEILINGTSNLHNWHMTVVASNCDAEFKTEGFQLKNIDNINFSCKVSDIKSDYSIMDRKTYEALKADSYPVIKFSLISNTELISDDSKFRGSMRGNLNAAGITREVTIHFTGDLEDHNICRVKGSVDLKMSDFKITPPTALLGTLKTGDNISVTFSLILLSKS